MKIILIILFIVKNEKSMMNIRTYVSFKAVTGFNSPFDMIKESKLPTLS